MTKKLSIFILLILSIHANSIACQCSINETITSEYQKADFVATLKIVKNYKNFPDTNQYYKADVEIVDLYKGRSLKSILILGNNDGDTYNSCGTFIKEGETRLIFGSYKENQITTYLCTSYHKPSELSYQRNKIREKLILLKKYSKNNIIGFVNEMTIYPYDLIQSYKPELSNKYSLVKITIENNKTIKKIKFLTKDNDSLKRTYKNYFYNTIDWDRRLKRITNKTNSKNMTIVFEIVPFRNYKTETELKPG